MVDPNFQFYPTNLDTQDPHLNQGSQEQQPDPNQIQGYSNSVFMGANTPGR